MRSPTSSTQAERSRGPIGDERRARAGRARAGRPLPQRRAAHRRPAHRAAVRDDERPARDDLARRPLHAAEPRLGAACSAGRARSCRRSRSRSSSTRTTSSRRSRCCSPAATARRTWRTSPTATATATARGAGCCGARAATATRGTRRRKDVTDRMWLERQALHDPLTQLPNRLLLMDRARQALARLHRSDGVVALLFIDLDRFKAVNDNFGHDVGDRLLIAVAERLAEMMRDSDTVARLGGDEFVILGEEIESDERSARAGRARRADAQGAVPRRRAPRCRCRRASASRSRTTARPTRRACCARPTWRCIAPRAPAGGARSCSTRACAGR